MANTGQICICACSDVSAQFRRIISIPNGWIHPILPAGHWWAAT